MLSRNRGADGIIKDWHVIYHLTFDSGNTESMDANTIATSIYDTIDNEGFIWLALDSILDHPPIHFFR